MRWWRALEADSRTPKYPKVASTSQDLRVKKRKEMQGNRLSSMKLRKQLIRKGVQERKNLRKNWNGGKFHLEATTEASERLKNGSCVRKASLCKSSVGLPRIQKSFTRTLKDLRKTNIQCQLWTRLALPAPSPPSCPIEMTLKLRTKFKMPCVSHTCSKRTYQECHPSRSIPWRNETLPWISSSKKRKQSRKPWMKKCTNTMAVKLRNSCSKLLRWT